jgi:hypothetical protein
MKKMPWRGQRRSLRRAADPGAPRHSGSLSFEERMAIRHTASRRGEAPRRTRHPRRCAHRSHGQRTALLLQRRTAR